MDIGWSWNYNRIEVYQFCKINKIDKEYIGISISENCKDVKKKLD